MVVVVVGFPHNSFHFFFLLSLITKSKTLNATIVGTRAHNSKNERERLVNFIISKAYIEHIFFQSSVKECVERMRVESEIILKLAL